MIVANLNDTAVSFHHLRHEVHALNQPDTVPALIVGAGPAGLTLACDLARRGLRPRVIDKAERLRRKDRMHGGILEMRILDE